MDDRLPTWREAWQTALYGPSGFYRRQAPAAHFRTSVHASPLFAAALVRLAREAGLRRLVDVGAGRGELLTQVAGLDPDLDLVGVEVSGRPDRLPRRIGWVEEGSGRLARGAGSVTGYAEAALVVANEWLDVVPCDVVEVDGHGRVRLLHVEPGTGREVLGGPPGAPAASWLRRGWDMTGAPAGARAEVGLSRDEAWAGLVDSASRSLLVAVDYDHRAGRRPAAGSLAGYRAGRQVPAVPDGTCDVTAHVALDSCAAAGAAAGATSTVLTAQRPALLALGVDGRIPPYDLALADPRAYVSALGRAGEAAELLRAGGLGGFGWLVQGVGVDVPEVLVSLAE